MTTALRLRPNFQAGILQSSIDDVATTIYSNQFPTFPVIDGASNYAALTIGTEIVWITSHIANAIGCTVARAQEDTAPTAHEAGDTWQCGPTSFDFSAVAQASRTYTQLVGDGVATSFVCPHNIGTNAVEIQCYDLGASEDQEIFPDKELTDINNCTITFDVAPLTGSVLVVVQGSSATSDITPQTLAVDSTVIHITGNETKNGTLTLNGNTYFASGTPWYDVRAFGAVGDGIANDTANIQSALTAAAVTGGRVFLPGQLTYLVTGLTISSNVKFFGTGSTLQLKAASVAPVILGTNVSNTIIDGINIDCNSIAQQGIYLHGTSSVGLTDCAITNCNIKNSTVEGLGVTVDTAGWICEADIIGNTISSCQQGILTRRTTKLRVLNNTCTLMTFAGINVAGDTSGIISNNICNNNSRQGIVIGYTGDAITYSRYTHVTNNTCNLNGTDTVGNLGWGINATNGAYGFTIANNTCNANYQGGITIDVAQSGAPGVNQLCDGTVVGNICVGFTGTHSSNGISTNFFRSLTISGNTVQGFTAGNGIQIYGRNGVISGNTVRGCASGLRLAAMTGDTSTPDTGSHTVGTNQLIENTTALNIANVTLASGAVFSGTNKFEYYNVMTFGAVGDGIVDDTVAIQAAITAAITGGKVVFPIGTYKITNQLTLPVGGKITLSGVNAKDCIIKGGPVSGYQVFAVGTNTTTRAANILIEGLTFDANNVSNLSCINHYFVSNLTIKNCIFQNSVFKFLQTNVTSQTTLDNDHIVFEDCSFSGLNGSQEAMTLANTDSIKLLRCQFQNINPYCVLLYQLCNHTSFQECTFGGITSGTEFVNTAVFYSLSCNDISFNDCRFLGKGSTSNAVGVSGANMSDHGAFGFTYVDSLAFTNCLFDGINTARSIGAVKSFKDIGSVIKNCAGGGDYVTAGNSPVSAIPVDMLWQGTTFKNNNQSNTSSVLHPGILFTSTVPGQDLQARITDCQFYDDQGSPTQLYPISFDGPGTFAGVKIISNKLVAYSGGTIPGIADSAILGGTIVFRQNVGYNPKGHAVTQPSVPASTVAQTNSVNSDCTVFVAGGTVTDISIGGSSTGLTSGAFRLPTGQTITLTYSVAPTWQWFGD